MAQISQLYIYPVKSLGGIALQQAQVTSRGLQHDRRWMLIDNNNRFLSQRSHAQLALFALAVTSVGIVVTYKPTHATITIPYQPQTNEKITVSIWDDSCSATVVSEEVNQWFSHILQINCRLVYMDDDDLRPVDPKYAAPGLITSFSDAYPMLLIGQSSLDDLNGRLSQAVSMDRFRPNMVIKGTAPYEEDRITHFTAGHINFYGVKPCARCVMTTIDQGTAIGGAEPLKTLSGYRKANKKIYFGQNLIHDGDGIIKIGDIIEVKKLGTELNLNSN
ncbi:MOSC domain-containing protein [Mucilaginibacter galii]|uniref:MOSC domain-containing protein n=1 Tax=Mucilaginibacter galii TaxID=2005073 RepID=A0A917N1N8_9SPHI|nr:MOSC N-terminal beta barrel domain-containing protein [Mucilaginibacter galii]GGI50659.1 MOSC domain-containing protein [Mucilaginibacter galii]